eukprot:55063-Rhodomonas_salina.3
MSSSSKLNCREGSRRMCRLGILCTLGACSDDVSRLIPRCRRMPGAGMLSSNISVVEGDR